MRIYQKKNLIEVYIYVYIYTVPIYIYQYIYIQYIYFFLDHTIVSVTIITTIVPYFFYFIKT